MCIRPGLAKSTGCGKLHTSHTRLPRFTDREQQQSCMSFREQPACNQINSHSAYQLSDFLQVVWLHGNSFALHHRRYGTSLCRLPHTGADDCEPDQIAILSLRLYAMYDRRRAIFAVLLALLAVEIIVETVLTTVITSKLTGRSYTTALWIC